MTASASALPDNPDLLKAMLLEERAESERLRLIIKALQRHRFGRRAESLPEDQLLLALEEAEQSEAAQYAKAEQSRPGEKTARVTRRRANRGALPSHLPRIETVVDVENQTCPCCAGTLHRIGEDARSASTSCRPRSELWSCAGLNTPAGHARRWSCRRRPLRA